MRTVTITVTDECGNVTNDPQKLNNQLDLETEGFDGIEKAVIKFKNQMLPDLQGHRRRTNLSKKSQIV